MPFKGSKNSPERGSDMARKVKKMSNKRYFDYSLLFVIIFIVGFGLVMIYSTSSYTAQMEYGSSEYYFKKQLIFDVLGFIMMYIMYRLFLRESDAGYQSAEKTQCRMECNGRCQ